MISIIKYLTFYLFFLDKQDDNDNSQPLEDKDGWVDLSDDEDEAKWRKIRHEREKFLAEKMVK